ncbi:hypothetical protein OSB04_031674 [Centaurea solstitialis]|uniref:CCHC-type domain-containing protein n=1 Tax=Centaurea solstitialis TaxID=347529 RepID=A0AA38W8B7_9ASTR|nr:hypothetical protein OSB04_031674 [Centaurea solstitialis]
MASTVTSTNNLSLRSILEKDKLTGSNFLDWERNLMIVLRHERKWYVLEEPLGEAPPANAPAAARNAHKKHSDDLLDVACLMLATMSPDLQAGLINTNAYDMIRQLRDMFQTQARTERYDATKAFNECKMVKGTSVSDHVMKMKRHLDHLERLGHPVPLQLATDTILNSLSEDYRPFVVNYNMNNMEKTIAELHSMLKTAELNMGNKNKTKDVLMVKDGGVKKKNGQASTSKGKGPVQAIQSAPKKGKGKGKGKKFKPNKARTENRCFICIEIGHWRQNCPKRHEAEGIVLTLKYLIVLIVLEFIPAVLPMLQMESDFSSTRRTFVGRSPVDYHQAIQFDPRIPTITQQKGHLEGVIPDEQGRPASPAHTKVINCITGGSEVCGLMYSAAKRHARDGPDERPIPDEVKSKVEKELDVMTIAFDQDDTQGVHHKHHDALVIQLTIENCLTKRILIDGGSSANVIFADTLKVMGIERSEIVRRSTTLIGFNGDSMNTLGEIILPVFAKGINKQTKFNVIDCQSAYNVILGRPWIHEMKAVPSTYHLKIKFPSPWGIQKIASEKKITRECYKITMKTKPQDI